MEEMIQVETKQKKHPRNGKGRKFGIALVFCAASVATLTSAAGPLDGVFRSGSQWGSKDWDARDLWDYHRLVQNGGVAYLMMDSFGEIGRAHV